jgi:1,4-dihydroxy-2-naphthoate octaprenyltransferase
MIALGTWAVFTGSLSWLPFVWMIPFGLVVIAVLHANNWRDRASDRERGVVSVAGLLGDRGSLAYYGALVFGPFALLLALMAAPRLAPSLGWTPMPWSFLLVFLSLPAALRLWGRARRRDAPREPLEFVTLDGATAQFMVPFGLLSVAAVVLAGLRPG